MTVASKHGKVAKLDFLFHKAGPQKGKPRGYAFVEYSTKEVRHDLYTLDEPQLTSFERSLLVPAPFTVRKPSAP